MAGKAYTMREMREIVEYLTERKAYGEVRGRKMWMEFANSTKTTRTWQSLKETFLKRILTDINNPYYRLSMDQVRSFREGTDVTAKEKNNKLEIETPPPTAVDSNRILATKDVETPTTSLVNQVQNKVINNPPNSSIDEELEKVTGEVVKAAKIPSRCRSSADTVVLEYENVEDVQRALESPILESESKPISLKDKLTFENSAPITSLVREIIKDFGIGSEHSDTESQLKIDEDLSKNKTTPETVVENKLENIEVENEPVENGKKDNEIDTVTEILDTDNSNGIEDHDKAEKTQKNHSDKVTHNDEESIANESNNQIVHQDVTTIESNTTGLATAELKISKSSDGTKDVSDSNSNTGGSTQNTSDILPNNQEALNDPEKTKPNARKRHDTTTDNKLGKRSTSTDSKKRKMSVEKSNNNGTSASVVEVVESHSPIIIEESPKINTASIEMNYISTSKTQQQKTTKGHGSEKADNPSNPDKNDPNTAMDLDEHVSPEIVELRSDANNTEDLFNALVKEASKKSTNNESEVPDITTKHDKITTVAEEKNPCLMSVSLFEEQFNSTKYSDSGSDEVGQQNQVKNTHPVKTKEKTATTDKHSKGMGAMEVEVVTNPNKSDDAPEVVKKKKEAEVVSHVDTPIIEKEKEKLDSMNLDSNSDSDQQKQGVGNTSKMNKSVNVQREKALANMFGFTHGMAGSSNRKRRLSHRRKSHHHQRHSKNMDSYSSEWTSESDSDSYVSPPHGRRNRNTKRYLKPRSSRVVQDPEEGTLYVIFGNKIYPLVKDGKHIKNYLTYRPDSGSDEDESFWRKKYAEEKQKVEEIRKLLKETQKSNANQERESTPTSTSRNTKMSSPQKSAQNKDSATVPAIENRTEPKDDKMVIKIAGKNGLEYCLEGGWNQISNAMPMVVKMMQTDLTTDNSTATAKTSDDKPNTVPTIEVISSRDSTPVIDKEVLDKVNKIETEIFKTIENLDATQNEGENKQSETVDKNVTRRKPRRESSSSAASKSSAKRAKIPNTNSQKPRSPEKPKPKFQPKLKQSITDPNNIEKSAGRTSEQQTDIDRNEVTDKVVEKLNDADDKPVRKSYSRVSKQRDKSENNSSLESTSGNRVSTRPNRTPQKFGTDSPANKVKYVKKMKSPKSTKKNERMDALSSDEESIRYMFPPESTTKAPGNKTRSLPEINIIPPKEFIENSVDSVHGYKDSSPSPMKICWPKRKRKFSFTARNKYRDRRVLRRSHPILQLSSSDSNNSSYFIPLRKSMSSLNSEVYRSDSYQLLVQRPKLTNNSEKLERIDEYNPILDLPDLDPQIRHFHSVSQESNKSKDDLGLHLEPGSSSNISLPLSPELSIVENMSISRDMIKIAEHPTINESQQNVTNQPMDYSEYKISNLDVSVPLMNQNLHTTTEEVTPVQASSSIDSMQLKDCTVNLTMSDTLDRRLRELLLESNKKPTQKQNEVTPMEVDQLPVTTKKTRRRKKENIDVGESKTAPKKPRAKKRSSTPQKKKTSEKTKALQEPILEEESVETNSVTRNSCPPDITSIINSENANNSNDILLNSVKVNKKQNSKPRNKKTTKANIEIAIEHTQSCASRKSCPPVMTVIPSDDNANNNNDISINSQNPKIKMKKDVIKVKIQKPNDRSRSKRNLRGKSVGNDSVASTYTDSGINDTETISMLLKDSSIDLIHNHSETCLRAKECIDDSNSVEFIGSPLSIIELSSSKPSEDSSFYRVFDNAALLSEETTNQDNVDAEAKTLDDVFESPKTRYCSPFGSINSLITEDLSNSPPPRQSNWYLLEEDITNLECVSNASSFGSNLQQIFPIACAVPNLSTITELSKDGEESRKASVDSRKQSI